MILGAQRTYVRKKEKQGSFWVNDGYSDRIADNKAPLCWSANFRHFVACKDCRQKKNQPEFNSIFVLPKLLSLFQETPKRARGEGNGCGRAVGGNWVLTVFVDDRTNRPMLVALPASWTNRTHIGVVTRQRFSHGGKHLQTSELLCARW